MTLQEEFDHFLIAIELSTGKLAPGQYREMRRAFFGGVHVGRLRMPDHDAEDATELKGFVEAVKQGKEGY